MRTRILGKWGWAAAAAVALAACSDKGPTTPVTPVDSTMVEARALWISRYDWTTAGDITALIDNAAAAHFNMIYFQVRGNWDAFYQPGLEPWGVRYSGVSPGWDPLQTAISEAHAKGLELHPWLNVLFCWSKSLAGPVESTPRHALLEHPDWFMVDASGQPLWGAEGRYASPAKAAVRSRIAAVAADIARRYAVDGIHLDYIRYPGGVIDSATTAGAAAAGMNAADYARQLVNNTVKEVHDSVRAVRSSLRLSAAVWGIYIPPSGWNTSNGYADNKQDPREWARQGYIEDVVPMVYWEIQSVYGARTDFAYLADDHAHNISNARVYIGIDLEHMMPTSVPNGTGTVNNLGTELPAEVLRARSAGAEGVSIFSGQLMRSFKTASGQSAWDLLANGVFKKKATVPGR